jgi:NADH-quinone oxidoreductase subunit L
MFLGLGTMTVAGIIAGMFHLFTHAFFKALLFLGAGSVMHAMGGVIDIRQFSGLRKKLPVTHFTFLIGCLALAGFPLLAGFWSKDAILAAVYDKARAVGADPADSYVYWPLLAAAVITSVLTAFYTFRAFFRTFYVHEQVPPEAGHHAHESPSVMTIPLMILAVFAAGAGVFMLVYPGFVERTPSLEFVARRSAAAESGHFHWNVAALSTAAALAGIGTAWLLYVRAQGLLGPITAAMRAGYLYQLSYGKLFFDQIYYVFIVWPLKVAAFVFRFFDNFVVDGCVNLLGWLPRLLGSLLRPLQIGLVQFYGLAMMLGLVVLIGTLLWWY